MDMSNDELTPEEREAMARLPRERMPSAGLEDRVVAAMRERGHLVRKPARVIRLTTSRVAGLLAACLVLMIGAYSIGIHNGVNNEVLKNVTPPNTTELSRESVRHEELGTPPPMLLGKTQSEETSPAREPEAQFIEKQAPPFEPKLNVPQIAVAKDLKKEKRAKADRVNDAMTESFSDRLSSQEEKPAPATDLSAPSSPPMQAQTRAGSAKKTGIWNSRTFAVNGGTLIVDAPDSVRVEADEQGRMLLIYTSDGIIRVRLAD
jgi:hypothetical protein